MSSRCEENAIQFERIGGSTCDRNMAVMWWVEAPTEEGYAHGAFSRNRSRLSVRKSHRIIAKEATDTPLLIVALVGKMKHKAHADLLDWVVVTVGPEGIKPAVTQLNHAIVHNRQQLDVQPRKRLPLEVAVDLGW